MKKLKLILIVIFMGILLSLIGAANLNKIYAAEEENTDFSNAKYSVTLDGKYAYLNISGIKVPNDSVSSFFYKITASNEAIKSDYKSYEEINNDGWKSFGIINEDGTGQRCNITEYVELNQDMYLWIMEYEYESDRDVNTKMVLNGKNLERPDMPSYKEIFTSSTFLARDSALIDFNIPWGSNTNRSFDIKIGKISDDSILQSLKNNENDSFVKLTEYAKSANAIYTKKLNASDGQYKCYHSDDKDGITQLSNLENGAYYYMYIVFDDENGKYYPIEGITLAQADTYYNINGSWFMFFLGNNSFKWPDYVSPDTGGNLPSNTPNNAGSTTTGTTGQKDNTIKTGGLPYTGKNFLILIAIVLLLVTISWFYYKNKKYNGIE